MPCADLCPTFRAYESSALGKHCTRVMMASPSIHPVVQPASSLMDEEMWRHVEAHAAPHVAKAVALIMRGQAFRGCESVEASRGHFIQLSNKTSCHAWAWEFQQIATASQLHHIIHPLEAHGYRVDVFGATFPVPRALEGRAHPRGRRPLSPLSALRGWYGGDGRRVATFSASCTHNADGEDYWERSQSGCIGQSFARFASAARASGASYNFVILWRYDLVPLAPFV